MSSGPGPRLTPFAIWNTRVSRTDLQATFVHLCLNQYCISLNYFLLLILQNGRFQETSLSRPSPDGMEMTSISVNTKEPFAMKVFKVGLSQSRKRSSNPGSLFSIGNCQQQRTPSTEGWFWCTTGISETTRTRHMN